MITTGVSYGCLNVSSRLSTIFCTITNSGWKWARQNIFKVSWLYMVYGDKVRRIVKTFTSKAQGLNNETLKVHIILNKILRKKTRCLCFACLRLVVGWRRGRPCFSCCKSRCGSWLLDAAKKTQGMRRACPQNNYAKLPSTYTILSRVDCQ